MVVDKEHPKSTRQPLIDFVLIDVIRISVSYNDIHPSIHPSIHKWATDVFHRMGQKLPSPSSPQTER